MASARSPAGVDARHRLTAWGFIRPRRASTRSSFPGPKSGRRGEVRFVVMSCLIDLAAPEDRDRRAVNFGNGWTFPKSSHRLHGGRPGNRRHRALPGSVEEEGGSWKPARKKPVIFKAGSGARQSRRPLAHQHDRRALRDRAAFEGQVIEVGTFGEFVDAAKAFVVRPAGKAYPCRRTAEGSGCRRRCPPGARN
jgi:hypothetical protein